MQSLDVISINIWQILISLLNLLIIFLLFKKFLYKPVRKFVDKRKASVDKQYDDAEKAEKAAVKNKEEYEEKLKNAKNEADDIIKSATETANMRSNRIISDAKEKADGMIRQASSEIELEKKKASDDIKKEIADVSTLLTETVLKREIKTTDQRKLIDSFIDGIGESDD
ncbi:MAG: F0F1 ATP synthase subunit B [Ruminococcus sp.]|nr:F0F1 ATP synthase subunit B [Candidatus Copronaster equi]